MTATRFHLYIIGILFINFHASMTSAQLKETTTFTGVNKMVTVEPSNVITTEVDGNYSIEPYRDRRPAWGKTISFSYSTYEPLNYEPNFLQVNFEDIYETPEMPLLEFQLAIKRNARSFSYGGELSVGIYQNDSDERDLIQSTLQIIPIKLGGVVLLDALRATPYFVPYASGGVYTILFKEDNNQTSITGNTQVAPYFNLGMAFSLDWMDDYAARISYEESGIEASYAFIEARSQFAASDEQDPDFSSEVNFAGGLKVEF
jgi:hypothetical protein